MSKKSATDQKKVESAMWILQTTTGVRVLQAMILAHFSKLGIANKTICRLMQGQRGSNGNKGTGNDSNGGGTDNNQQSTKSGGGNCNGNGNSVDDNNDDNNENKCGGGCSLVAVRRGRQLSSSSAAVVGSMATTLAVQRQWQQRGSIGQLGLGGSTERRPAWPWRQHSGGNQLGLGGSSSTAGGAVAAWQWWRR
jgi:hypothetical protein